METTRIESSSIPAAYKVKKFFNTLLELDDKKTGVGSSSIPATYKGVSYNPLLSQYGERFDILDFFSWGRGVQQAFPDFRFLVLDATLYWAVNAIPEPLSKKPIRAGDSLLPVAEEVVGNLRKRLVTKTGEMVRQASEIRNRYLRAIASLFPNGSVQVVNGDDL
ncbi:MAG: hypothetical protein NT157_02390, partial [Candidatus Micrarchaeota archaeon]|nr:hypothetical protein [Candidatus Micrarchaeota archaeon]